MAKRAQKYRFYPIDEQSILLAQTFGCARVVYNNILRWRTDAFYKDQQKIGYTAASCKLTALKKEPEFKWLNDVSCVPLQQKIRDQQAAFSNFFAGRAKYPTYKKKSARPSVEFTKSGFKIKDGKIYIAKSKAPLNVRWSRDLSSESSSITISKDGAGRYFVSCLCEFEPVKLPVSPNTVGVDLGITHFSVTDDGSKLAKVQRALSKKKLGGANRAKAKLKVGRVHAKISDSRLHKLSRKLINENQIICVESLNVNNMITNHCLDKHVVYASWGKFVR
jgi:putative transposase